MANMINFHSFWDLTVLPYKANTVRIMHFPEVFHLPISEGLSTTPIPAVASFRYFLKESFLVFIHHG